MSVRNIRLTLKEHRHVFSDEQHFIISVTDAGVEIRREGAPVASRDRAILAIVGCEPDFVDVTLHVEEAMC